MKINNLLNLYYYNKQVEFRTIYNNISKRDQLNVKFIYYYNNSLNKYKNQNKFLTDKGCNHFLLFGETFSKDFSFFKVLFKFILFYLPAEK